MTLWGVYLLECADGTLYCGVTPDMEQRLIANNEGRGAKYTRGRLPVSLVAFSGCRFDHGEALRQERAAKRLPARQKEAHIRVLADKPDGGTP